MRVFSFAFLFLSSCTVNNPSFGVGGDGFDLAVPSCDPTRLSSDVHHCGGCDNDCTLLPNVDPTRVTCVAGSCALAGACRPGFADCTAAPGCESDLTAPEHCGSCGKACSGSTPICVSAPSNISCSDHCPSTAPTLCGNRCVDTQTDAQHCGGCTACPAPQHGVAVCSFSVCDVACDPGFHGCGDLCLANASPQSCGSSCDPCPAPLHGTALCAGGQCDFTCDNGFVKSGASCVPAGGGCTSGSCQAGQACVDGACCVAPGQSCTNPGDCCSGNCDTANPFFPTCLCTSSGMSCNADGDCCTLKCTNSKCACLPLASSCGSNEDCCTGNCDTNTGKCACGAVGAKCSGASDCCTNVCGGNGLCSCKSSGSCNVDGDCCNGRCDNGTCNNCGTNGTGCSVAGQCCSKVCSGTCQCANRGQICTRNSDCCSNFCNSGICGCASPDFAGDKCVKSDDCCVGTCSSGACVCKAEMAGCLTSAECCDGLQCVGSKCTACVVAGGNCTTNVGQTQCCTLRNETCPGATNSFCCAQTGGLCFQASDCCNNKCGADSRCQAN